LKSPQSYRKLFEEIYNTYFERLFYYAKKITDSEEMAKDVVSDVFLNLLNKQTDFSEINELESYLFVSVKNLSIHALSLDSRHLSTVDIENSLRRVEGLNPEEVLVEKELLKVIQDAIENLPDQCKLVYHFVKGKNMKYKEAADELGITEGTVRNHLIKAVKTIKEKVEQHINDQPDSEYFSNLASLSIILFYCSISSL
tara:strand:- start:9926 stop:10522 length:597 start_codon:yes stop_codon:yes gene_type:complete